MIDPKRFLFLSLPPTVLAIIAKPVFAFEGVSPPSSEYAMLVQLIWLVAIVGLAGRYLPTLNQPLLGKIYDACAAIARSRIRSIIARSPLER